MQSKLKLHSTIDYLHKTIVKHFRYKIICHNLRFIGSLYKKKKCFKTVSNFVLLIVMHMRIVILQFLKMSHNLNAKEAEISPKNIS